MKKILLSVAMIAAVAAIGIGATTAYFSDTETSTGNTFTAGALDLTVDNTQHYNGNVCQNVGQTAPDYQWVGESEYPVPGTPCDGTWLATNLGAQKFFNFLDVKPGDQGEDTISLHVDNDAWLRLIISGVTNDDMSSTEPELAVSGETLEDPQNNMDGELNQNLLFSMWLDQGVTPGFQGPSDLSECDNDYIAEFEPMIITPGPIDPQGEIWNLADYNGLYLTGGEVPSCFGVNWSLPASVGNEVQTDSVTATMEFQVLQHRNNPTPTWN